MDKLGRGATKAYVAGHVGGVTGPRRYVDRILVVMQATNAPDMQPHDQSRIYAELQLPLFTRVN